MISLSHWRRAVQVAGYINRANDLYSFVLPFLNPVTGLTRLGTREWIVKPAWKSMQQNVLRWFYQAYVNRLGMHLIELMSGRLAIGAHHYRRLTKRPRMGSSGVLGEEHQAAGHRGGRGSGRGQVSVDQDDSGGLLGRDEPDQGQGRAACASSRRCSTGSKTRAGSNHRVILTASAAESRRRTGAARWPRSRPRPIATCAFW